MVTNWDIQKAIREKFVEYCKKLELEPYQDVGLFFTAEENGRWGKTYYKEGGDAEETCIELHLNFFIRMPENVPQAVAHELCHVKDKCRNHHEGHWAELMKGLGFKPNARNRFDESRKPVGGNGGEK